MTERFDWHRAEESKDEAIERVEKNASKIWMARAEGAVIDCCRRRPEGFTTDDVMEQMRRSWGDKAEPREPRALGAVMRNMQRDGWIEATDFYRSSGHRRSHNRPKRVWIYSR